MEKIKHESTEYARIKGVGLIVISGYRMTLHEAINAKSYQAGLPTRYFQRWNEGDLYCSAPIRCRNFISLCHIRIQEFKEMPNHSGWLQPNCF